MVRSTHDLAISAVSYDALLVAELSQTLAPDLGSVPYWRGDQADVAVGIEADTGPADIAPENGARLALVLHQRLWGHERVTRSDALALRERARVKNHSPICVVTLDEEPVPDWLAAAPRCAIGSSGLAAAATLALDALGSLGTTNKPRARAASAPLADGPIVRPGWGDAPQPFLAQSRAVSSFKREFDALATELTRQVKSESDLVADRKAQVHSSPNRIVVQLGRVGLSFSWMGGLSGTIADGRLLVIEWEGIVAHAGAPGTTRTASPTRESLFRPDAKGPDDWCWRAADAGGGAYSSRNLAGQSFAGALITLGRSTAATV